MEFGQLPLKCCAECVRLEKPEARISESETVSNLQSGRRSENTELRKRRLGLSIEVLGFVSDFEIRDSDFPEELLVLAPPGWGRLGQEPATSSTG
jgi:hypothetical protein